MGVGSSAFPFPGPPRGGLSACGGAYSLLVALSDRLRRLLKEGQVDDPRFRSPSRFPCGVVGCDERADGWVLREALALHGLGELRVRSDLERVYLCRGYLIE